MLTGATDEARKRVQMNWRLAVPQFYWPKGIHRGRIQLFLPLRRHANHAADLALVVEREGTRYVGYTILTVSMAYKNARLLSRPESDWLWIPQPWVNTTTGRCTESKGDESDAVVLALVVPSEAEPSELSVDAAESG